MHISGLYIYPIKSFRGIAVPAALATARGFVDDRRWMVVDDTYQFMSQRTLPAMAMVRTALTNDGILLTAPSGAALLVPPALTTGDTVDVQVWRHRGPSFVHHPASPWLAQVFGRPLHLVYQGEAHPREVNPLFGTAQDQVSFADGYPYLLANEKSLATIAAACELPLSMQRFRPNIVIDGADAFAEDFWRQVQLPNASFRAVKPCERCSVISIDPESGQPGVSLLKALGSLRRRGNQVFFGVNLCPDSLGWVRLGDAVRVAP